MKRDIIRLIKKIALLSLPPFVLLVLLYIYLDPFKVVRSYPSYFESGQISPVEYNREHVATVTLLNNNPRHYDSFIFGNSTGMTYRISDWKKYIHASECYHFEAWHDLASGVLLKLKFLKRQGCSLKNVLIVANPELLSDSSDFAGPIYFKDPRLLGHGGLKFQIGFFNLFTDHKFLISYMDYVSTKKINRFYTVLLPDTLGYNSQYNEVEMLGWNNEIKKNSDAFYSNRRAMFQRIDTNPKYSAPVIMARQRQVWMEIQYILQMDNADVRIIISPDYGLVRMNEDDLAFLDSLFGKNHVFDFTGKNSITENMINYYDRFHYRPEVAGYILHEVYTGVKSLPNDSNVIF